MDADLTKDLGLIPFKKKFPKRHIQAGIAEQDMVSFAGGMSLQGLVPVVHSFACFMTPRANEQMYNNATEHAKHEKIIYVGGLAGILPGMPGHSHQSVRDIAIMSTHPELTIVEPADEAEARRAVDFALLTNGGSTYIRLVSVPWEIPFRTPEKSLDKKGVGSEIKSGRDVIVIGYGPILTSEAFMAAKQLEKENISVSVINMPWLNVVDREWLAATLRDAHSVIVLDNHFVKGGLGEQIAAVIAELGIKIRVRLHGITEIPAYGQNDEVLKYHRLDRESLVDILRG